MDRADVALAAKLLRIHVKMLMRNIESSSLASEDGKVSIEALRLMVATRKEEISLARQQQPGRSGDLIKHVAEKARRRGARPVRNLAEERAAAEARLLQFRRKAK